MIRRGAWKGRTVTVLGGGPSARRHDYSRTDWRYSIACNMGFLWEPAPAAALIFDDRLAETLSVDARWRNFDGIKFSLAREEELPGAVRLRRMRGWSSEIEDGLCARENCGLAALNLADVLCDGDGVILAAGFDFLHSAQPAGKLITNWHDEYPEDWRSNAAQLTERWRKDFAEVEKFIRTPLRVME